MLSQATVLLNANVGFLAINTVDKGGRNAIQMASYMSLVTSLGSIVLGLFFVSHDRTSGTNTATEAVSIFYCIAGAFLMAVGLGSISRKTSRQQIRNGKAGYIL
jgi:cytochrome bd-type quinol oxidase subunit 2